ncbi:MAG: sigma-70 family RNA polymerase sigma factor [Acidimicrobiia bacterium]|jgi:RNA polymerase sigma-70 factor (ECF subfamily)
MTDRAAADIDLIEQYLGGDVGAFDELMRAHEDRVFAICLRMLRDREQALDATQETFLTVFRKVDRYRAQAAFSTWLYRVAVNACYDHLRRTRRHQADPLPDRLDPVDVTSGDAYTAVELRPDIETALAEIAPEFRAAVVLVDLEGLALETVAELLGVPVGTVKSRVFRGRRQLASHLGNLRAVREHPMDE